jgi:hypothetical protein
LDKERGRMDENTRRELRRKKTMLHMQRSMEPIP